jgi:hypothetical protein
MLTTTQYEIDWDQIDEGIDFQDRTGIKLDPDWRDDRIIVESRETIPDPKALKRVNEDRTYYLFAESELREMDHPFGPVNEEDWKRMFNANPWKIV